MKSLIKWIVSLAIMLGACVLPGTAAAKDYLYVPCVNSLHIIDCETNTVIKKIPYNDYIVNATYSADGKWYYLNAIHSVYIIDTETNSLVDQIKFSTPMSKMDIFGMAVSEDNTTLYLACNIVKKKPNIPRLNVYPPQLIVYDLKKRKMVKNHTLKTTFTGLVTLRNDPDSLILVGLDIEKLNLKTGKTEKILGLLNPKPNMPGKNSMVVWQNTSPGDHGLFVNPFYTAEGMGYMIIDKNSGKIDTITGKDVWFEYSNAVSPDKKYIYGVMDELLKIDMATGETLKMIPVEQGTCYTLNLNSDGSKIYVGPAGADVSIYDTKTFALLGKIPLDSDGVVAHRISK